MASEENIQVGGDNRAEASVSTHARALVCQDHRRIAGDIHTAERIPIVVDVGWVGSALTATFASPCNWWALQTDTCAATRDTNLPR